MCDEFDPDAGADEDESQEHEQRPAEQALTPGERLLYALGQLYRLHHRGQLPVEPAAFDIEDLARIIGVWPEVEFSVEDGFGLRYHLPGEVLSVEPERSFPWRLLDPWESGAELVLVGVLGLMSTSGPDLLVASFLVLSDEEQDESFERLHRLRVEKQAGTDSEAGRFIRSLQRVAEQVGGVPTIDEYKAVRAELAEDGESIEAFARLYRFFGSWPRATEALELSKLTTVERIEARFRERRIGKVWRYTEELLRETLMRAAEHWEPPPSTQEFEWWRQRELERGAAGDGPAFLPSTNPYRQRFGTWEAALLHFGFTPEQAALRLEGKIQPHNRKADPYMPEGLPVAELRAPEEQEAFPLTREQLARVLERVGWPRAALALRAHGPTRARRRTHHFAGGRRATSAPLAKHPSHPTRRHRRARTSGGWRAAREADAGWAARAGGPGVTCDGGAACPSWLNAPRPCTVAPVRPDYRPIFSVPAVVVFLVVVAAAMVPVFVTPRLLLLGIVLATFGGVLGLNHNFGNPLWKRLGDRLKNRLKKRAPKSEPAPPELDVQPVVLTFAGVVAVCFIASAALEGGAEGTKFLLATGAALLITGGLFFWQATKVAREAATHWFKTKLWVVNKEKRGEPHITLYSLGRELEQSERAWALALVLVVLGGVLAAIAALP